VPEQYDLVIRGGLVVDGTGAPGVRADVGLRGDRIAAVGSIEGDTIAGETLDASLLVVAPGFIDVHAHDDILVLAEPDVTGKSMQGVTTVVNGNCGSGVVPQRLPTSNLRQARVDPSALGSWDDHAGYLGAIEERPPSINVAQLIGLGTLRGGVIGSSTEQRPATAEEIERMRGVVREGLEAGAVGVSTGLIYEPGRYVSTEEIIAVAGPLGDLGGVYASHVRGEGPTLLDAHAEAIAIGEALGRPVEISHHKASGRSAWGRVRDSLAQIEAAQARGVEVHADQYPYTAGSTRLGAMVQNEFFTSGGMTGEDILLAAVPGQPDLEGLSVADLSERWDLPAEDAARRLVAEEDGNVIAIAFMMDEADVRTVMRHPSTMIGTDGIGWGSRPHPRHFGSYPRILGHYVRDEGVLTLEEAVHKAAGMPAAKFDLVDRGAIREGAFADLVLFDPETVSEVSTYQDPRRTPEGMPFVFVNGKAVVRDGEHTHARAGRVLRRGQ
jgi:N-acyl-D-amino-acid deacylase